MKKKHKSHMSHASIGKQIGPHDTCPTPTPWCGRCLEKLVLDLLQSELVLGMTTSFSQSRNIDEGLPRPRLEIANSDIVDWSVAGKLDDPRHNIEEFQLLRHDIAVALSKLEPREKAIVEGVYRDQMATSDIAEKMGLSPRRVQMILREAKVKLARLLSTERHLVKPLPPLPLPPSLGFFQQREMLLSPQVLGRLASQRHLYSIDDILNWFYRPESCPPPQEILPDIKVNVRARKAKPGRKKHNPQVK